ncbi:putative Cytochrome P450 [Seiridium cardinale]
MAAGTDNPCIQANVIKDREAKLNAEELTSISLTMPSGGLEKAVSGIRMFFGDDKDDDQQCPYIVALVCESLRYYAVLRLAVPTCSIRDVVYNGVTIPKGTVVSVNSWVCNEKD